MLKRNSVIAVAACVILTGAAFAPTPEAYKPGLTALPDLGTGTYQGFQGGLYPGGTNTIPAAHAAAGMAMSQNIVPRDANGNPDPVNGKIVFVSIGLSNTEQKFEKLIALATVDPEIDNTRVVFVNTAQGSMAVHEWADPSTPDHATIWATFESRLADAQVTLAQVQAAWMLHTAPSGMLDPFPTGAIQTKDWMRQTLQIFKQKCPNASIVYVSPRAYAGWAVVNLNPEPVSYENGFAVKWLIEDQINGDPEMAFDGPAPKVPWLCWGNYLWTNGLGSDLVEGGASGGRSDGFEWRQTDVGNDGTHPSDPQGREKAALEVLTTLKAEPTATPWLLESSEPPEVGGGGGGGCTAGRSEGNALPILAALVVLLVLTRARRERPTALKRRA